MAALALSLAFFLYLTGLGRATLALCNWRGGILRAWLLAPAAGLATIVLMTISMWPIATEISRNF